MSEGTWEESKRQQMDELLKLNPNHEDALTSEAVTFGDIKEKRTTFDVNPDGNEAVLVDQNESVIPEAAEEGETVDVNEAVKGLLGDDETVK